MLCILYRYIFFGCCYYFRLDFNHRLLSAHAQVFAMLGTATRLVVSAVVVAFVAELVVRNYNLLRPRYTSAELSTADCQLVGADRLAGSEDLVRGRYATLFIGSGDLHTCFHQGQLF